MVRPDLPDKWRRVKALVQEKEGVGGNDMVVEELFKIVTEYYGESIEVE